MRQMTLELPAFSLHSLQEQRQRLSGMLRESLQTLLVHVAMPMAGVKVHCEGSLPDSGPFVLAVNHNSHLDTPVMMSVMNRKQRKALRIAASHRYFFDTKKVMRRAAVALFGLVPATGRQLINTAHRIKKERSIMLIYPEGTRSRTGKMGTFQYGIGVLHRESEVPVIPIKIEGTRSLMPAGRFFPKRGEIRVTIGEPLRANIADANTITTMVEQKVREL